MKRFVALIGLLLSLTAHADQIVKIGHVAPLTGESANVGKDDQNGAVLAVEEINRKGLVIDGQKLKLVLDSEDDAADPRIGTQVAQKLVDDGVVAVVGHEMSSTSIPAAPIYAAAGVAQVTQSASDPQFTKLGLKTTFRIVGTDAQQGPALADYAIKVLGYKTFAVQDDQTSYGFGLANEFAKQVVADGGTVMYRGGNSNKAVDFRAVLTLIKGMSPDAIFYAGEEATGGPFFKQAMQLNLQAKFLTGDSVCTDELATLSGIPATQRLTCSEPDTAFSLMQYGSDFDKRYQARFHQSIVDYAPYSYDAVYLIVDAMVRAQSTNRAAVLASLKKSNYQGITALMSFDAHGDLKHPVVTISNYINGKKTPIKTVSP